MVRDVIESGQHSSNYGPVKAIERFDPPAEDECADLTQRRFSLWQECKA
jgi:hypothetical protein